MKIGFAVSALALGAFGTVAATSGSLSADEGLETKMGVSATLDAKAKQASVVLKGKEGGVYVNKEYPIKCSVTIASGGTLAKSELTAKDVVWEESGKEGKATSATFKFGADKTVEGKCKLVACSTTACSSPFEVKFKSN